MVSSKIRQVISITALFAVILAAVFVSAPTSSASAAASTARGRFIIAAKSGADLDALRAEVTAAGGKVLSELRGTHTLVVSVPAGNFRNQIAASTHVRSVAADRVEKLILPDSQNSITAPTQRPQPIKVNASGATPPHVVTPDPAFSLPGLLWTLVRIHAPLAWNLTGGGDPAVKVGVADTGLDYTHVELASQVESVVDFTLTEDPPLCSTNFGASDADWAALYGGPADGDWNGHGSWIGGNIAAALNGQGINGIAPNIKLVALKISQWCGSAYDSTILNAFQYAADNNIDIVSISFGGYLDRTQPDQDLIYQQYVDMVAYAKSKGTVIVAAAGNEHLQIGDGGLVTSHGPLATPGATFTDYFGLYEEPGGIPGVVDISSTGNLVNPTRVNCPSGSIGDASNGNAWCKPKSDAHQPTGQGLKNQLAYYSNYGPRIDVAAPGGAREFNLPTWDRGGTPGYPVTTNSGYNAWEDFSITSNWALEIPCYTISGGGFPPDQCYTTIQGTSMATPHASAVLALIASKFPAARHNPAMLVSMLKDGAQHVTGNWTPGLSATDTSASDRTGATCPTGYCHLGGPAISDSEAYGAGLVDAAGPLMGH